MTESSSASPSSLSTNAAVETAGELLSDGSAQQAGSQANPVSEAPDLASTDGDEEQSGLQLFFTTFVTIFVAELGDKTQVTTLLMSAESQAPWVVFLGAGSALVLTTLLGVFVGRWLSKHVSVDTLETITAGILMVIAVLLLWDVVSM